MGKNKKNIIDIIFLTLFVFFSVRVMVPPIHYVSSMQIRLTFDSELFSFDKINTFLSLKPALCISRIKQFSLIYSTQTIFLHNLQLVFSFSEGNFLYYLFTQFYFLFRLSTLTRNSVVIVQINQTKPLYFLVKPFSNFLVE